MKKLLMVIAFVSIGIVASAQNWKGEIGFGASRHGGDFDGDYRFSWLAGVGYEFEVSGPFSIQPSINIVKKGTNKKVSGSKIKSNAYYLEVPVMASYRFLLSDINLNLVPQVGAYLGYGFAGKTKAAGIKADTFSNRSIKEQDFGIAFKIEAEWQDYLFGLRYSTGLKDINNGSSGSIRNKSILFSVGVRF